MVHNLRKIYGEDIRDLLEPANVRVSIREDETDGVHVYGALEQEVDSAESAMLLLEQARTECV